MLCPHCKAGNPAGAKHCAHCGAPLTAGSQRAMHGRYTIQHSLGKGGMGAIYLASETIAGRSRRVVIKEMLDYYDPKDPQAQVKARKRFEAEAATLASLNVAGVPQIFDYFSEGDRNYIVMQFIEGQNLEARLTHVDDNGDLVNGRPYPVEQARRWGVKLCRILEALADQGIVHMDIKPSNLILDRSGDIWLVDFGTAKARHGWQPGAPPTPGARQAAMQKSSVYGTIGYAPPEQIAGDPQASSDVYALAATLYHLMTDDDPGDHPDKFPRLGALPGEIRKALKGALQISYKKRSTAGQFRRALDVQPGRGPAFHWRDGTPSIVPKDLAATADQKWAEALGYFRGGEWEKWFKDSHRYDLVDQIKTEKANHGDGDRGLDAFLRLLDPAYPPPSLGAAIPILDVGILPWRSLRKLDLELVNQGSGCLQGSFVNLPPGVQVEPLDFATHERKTVQVRLDTGELTPKPNPQTLFLALDAGPGGKLQVPLKVMVPEPSLQLLTPAVDIGEIHPHEASAEVRVRNQGGSEFVGEARCAAEWVAVRPEKFRCGPGMERKLDLRVNARRLSFGQHSTQLEILAQAGGWQQVAQAPLRVHVSFREFFWKNVAPPLAWLTGWATYGGLLGALAGALVAGFGVWVTGASAAILAGTLFAVLACLLPAAFIGAFGGLPAARGRQGLRSGALLGLVVGTVAGALSSNAALDLVALLKIDLVAGQGWPLYLGLVGLSTGMLLGAVLWLLPPSASK